MITLESYINNIDKLDILDGYSLENGSMMMLANEGRNFRVIAEYGAYGAIVAVASIKKAIH